LGGQPSSLRKNMIYGGTKGYVFSINESTGKEVWRTKLETGSFMALPESQWE